jgi:DNA polymerase III subunit epsilon
MDAEILISLVCIAAVFVMVIAIAIRQSLSNRDGKGSDTLVPKQEPIRHKTEESFHENAAKVDIEPAKPSRSLHDLIPQKFVVFDLETTGLSAQRDEIIEIGAMIVTLDTQVQKGWHSLIKPTGKIPKAATRVNGITDQMVAADGIPLDEGLRQFFEFVGDLPLVSFNAAFDIAFLKAAADRCGMQVRNRYACALKRARRAWPELESHKLSYLAEIFKLDRGDEHRALGDCKRTAWVFLQATANLQTKVRWSTVE